MKSNSQPRYTDEQINARIRECMKRRVIPQFFVGVLYVDGKPIGSCRIVGRITPSQGSSK